MTTPSTSKQVSAQRRLAHDAEDVAGWLADPRHLGLWTDFFVEVGEAGADGSHPARTLLGDAQVWTERRDFADGIEIDVRSRRKTNTETARLLVQHQDDGFSLLSLTITVRDEGAPVLGHVESRLERELSAVAATCGVTS